MGDSPRVSPVTSPRLDGDTLGGEEDPLYDSNEEPTEEELLDEYRYLIKRLNHMYPSEGIEVPEGADSTQLRRLYDERVASIKDRSTSEETRHWEDIGCKLKTWLDSHILSRTESREGNEWVSGMSPRRRYECLIVTLNLLVSETETDPSIPDGPLRVLYQSLLGELRSLGPLVVSETDSTEDLKRRYEERLEVLVGGVVRTTKGTCLIL